MPSDTDMPVHIAVHSRCDLCENIMIEEEKCIVLIGNLESTAFSVGVPVPAYHALSMDGNAYVVVGRWKLCNLMSCRRCDDPPDAVTFHLDCLKLFMRNCTGRDALDKLWLAVIWRKALAGVEVEPLRLPTSPTSLSSAFAFVAGNCNLPQIKKLPQEVRDTIQELSEPHPLLRYMVVLESAWRLSTSSSEPLGSLPLRQVSSWTRGSSTELVGEATVPMPIIRCTIDSIGLRKIERLAARPRFEETRYDNMVFIVEHEDRFRDAVVQFKNGIARLNVPESGKDLQIWDTPTPPDLFRHRIKFDQPPRRFSTIDMGAITGLTFVMFYNNLVAIHPHTKAAVSAVSSVDRISDWYPRDAFVWVYVPLPRGETLLGFGPLVRKHRDGSWVPADGHCFLLRLLLAGDVIVGRRQPAGLESFLLNKGQPAIRTLLHDTSYSFHPIVTSYPFSYLSGPANTGAVSWSSPLMTDDWDEYPPMTDDLVECPLKRWHRSYANLENVSRVHVSQEPERGYCRGLLFEYENGAQRAVGQCRLHVDPVGTFEKPKTISFSRTEQDGLAKIRVHFSESHDQGGGWAVRLMAGMLGFYFDEPGGLTWISVSQPSPTRPDTELE
ncbi:hypothetical protein CONLIGDRAFT_513196 [Coniochaeta ligniaria NRRL 30616]|uniref:Uncharacterized protein n=1 Tax=Coniochaeta ligniaria NRRL 30616 TaxID=1408157 RepID=A0A1J7IEW5_9PEZI|nr:hypothetical protein CONLIGDRAFT_513196 [Coniochaeta ligniaria NRRL 30616]